MRLQDLKRELICGCLEGRHRPLFRARRFTPAALLPKLLLTGRAYLFALADVLTHTAKHSLGSPRRVLLAFQMGEVVFRSYRIWETTKVATGTVKWFKRAKDSFSPITAARMCSCTSPRSKKLGSAHSNEGAKVSYEEVPTQQGEDFGGEFEGRVTSEGHGEARRLTPEGGARFAAPGICSPNCASHRGFGTFEGIVCRDIRHWRMIHGASRPNDG